MTHHIGYKKIQDGYIVKLAILEDGKNNELRKDVKRQNIKNAKMRCSKALVLDIYKFNECEKTRIDKGYGLYDTNFCYEVGKEIEVNDYDDNLTNICSTGIHYFLSEEPAFFWKFNFDNYTGEYKMYHENGQLNCQEFYKDGERDGETKGYYENGQLRCQRFYKDGKLDGEYKWYYGNGQLWCQGFYKDGILHGEYKEYHENGQLRCQSFYKDGKLDGEYKEYYGNGKLMCQRFYKDGERDGEYKEVKRS